MEETTFHIGFFLSRWPTRPIHPIRSFWYHGRENTRENHRKSRSDRVDSTESVNGKSLYQWEHKPLKILKNISSKCKVLPRQHWPSFIQSKYIKLNKHLEQTPLNILGIESELLWFVNLHRGSRVVWKPNSSTQVASWHGQPTASLFPQQKLVFSTHLKKYAHQIGSFLT